MYFVLCTLKIELGGSGVKVNRSVETSKSLIGYPPGIGDNLLFDRSKIITASSPPFCRGRLQRRHYQIHCQRPAISFVKLLHFLAFCDLHFICDLLFVFTFKSSILFLITGVDCWSSNSESRSRLSNVRSEFGDF